MKYFFHISLTNKTYARLKDLEIGGHVHSVFNHTFYILLDDYSLLNVTEAIMKSSANTLSVLDLKVSTLNLVANDQVVIKDNKITIANKVILDYNEVYLSERENVDYPIDDSNVINKLECVLASSWYQDLVVAKGRADMVVEMFKLVNEAIARVENELLNNEVYDNTSLKALIGLGIGLTPSGDDFLSGLAYISSLANYPDKSIYLMLKDLKDDVKHGTNVISYNQFALALNSEVKEPVRISLNALLSDEDYNASEELIKYILMIGSTSGFDTLQGMLFGIKFAKKSVIKI